jgi:hypothetical protein
MDTPDSTTLKACRKCGEVKPYNYDYFPLSRGKLQSECRACVARRGKEWYEANKERRAEQVRTYRASNKESVSECGKAWYKANKERHRAKSKEWAASNKQRISERSKALYESTKERRREQTKAWRAANPDKVRAYSRQRRAITRGAGGTCTAEDVNAIRQSQTDKKGRLICWRCGKPITGTPHLDHWIPLDKHGGDNSPGNLHFMHRKCNLTKSNKHPFELGRLI